MHETAIGQIRQITPPMAVSEANSPPSEAISRCIRYSAQSMDPVIAPLFASPERAPAVKDAIASDNSADAFMSLPFGHPFKRTQTRMERSGAKVLTPREESLLMEGFFEGRPALYSFGFHKKKGMTLPWLQQT